MKTFAQTPYGVIFLVLRQAQDKENLSVNIFTASLLIMDRRRR